MLIVVSAHGAAAVRTPAPTDSPSTPVDGASSEKEALIGQKEALFQYEKFWGDRIEAKKRDHSYRVFRNVQRDAGTFPYAQVCIIIQCTRAYIPPVLLNH